MRLESAWRGSTHRGNKEVMLGELLDPSKLNVRSNISIYVDMKAGQRILESPVTHYAKFVRPACHQ